MAELGLDVVGNGLVFESAVAAGAAPALGAGSGLGVGWVALREE